MAPAPHTEDYYAVLEVEHTATPELIRLSYRQLALKLHPDRNTKNDTTEAFQLLGKAYEVLKDESQRRAYDLYYPFIKRSPHNARTHCPSSASTTQSHPLSEAAQLIALQEAKRARLARWRATKYSFDSSIWDLQRDSRQLEKEIQKLNDTAAAEIAKDAQRNSWSTWLLSSIFRSAEESEEEKARKDRTRQERRIEKDMKERRLMLKKESLKKEHDFLQKAKEEVDAADACDSAKIQALQESIRFREMKERQERDRAAQERSARIWKQQQQQREQREREAAEAARKQQVEQHAAEQKRQEEYNKIRQNYYQDQHANLHQSGRFFQTENVTRHTSASTCLHYGWWPKVQGHTLCPECSTFWTYLLQCPGCQTKACPTCQGAIRRRRPRNATKTN